VSVEPTIAHSGGTDSAGGHRDNKNVSGLGYYHYHHGYGPHLHPNGICPYVKKSSETSNDTTNGSMFFSYAIGATIVFFVMRKVLTRKKKEPNAKNDEMAYKKANTFTENHEIIAIQKTETDTDTEIPTCPKCGSWMVLRKGKYGGFYGCSRYPKCRGTKNSKLVTKQ